MLAPDSAAPHAALASLGAGISAQWVNILATTSERTTAAGSSSRGGGGGGGTHRSGGSGDSSSRTPGAGGEDGDEVADADVGLADAAVLLRDDLSVGAVTASGAPAAVVAPAFPDGIRRPTLIAMLSLTCSIIALPATSKLLYSNDLKVLTDVMLRELADLPVLDHARICWLGLLKAVLLQSQWSDAAGCGRYRGADVVATLSSLFDVSTALASGLPLDVRAASADVLVACREVLE